MYCIYISNLNKWLGHSILIRNYFGQPDSPFWTYNLHESLDKRTRKLSNALVHYSGHVPPHKYAHALRQLTLARQASYALDTFLSQALDARVLRWQSETHREKSHATCVNDMTLPQRNGTKSVHEFLLAVSPWPCR